MGSKFMNWYRDGVEMYEMRTRCAHLFPSFPFWERFVAWLITNRSGLPSHNELCSSEVVPKFITNRSKLRIESNRKFQSYKFQGQVLPHYLVYVCDIRSK